MAQETNKQDQYGMFSLFPMFMYRGRLQSHNKWREQIVPIIERRYKEQNGSNSSNKDEGGSGIWNCDCYTSFFDESQQDHSKETEIPIGELLGDLSLNIQECIKGAEFYPHAFMVSQQWFNAYGPKQNQETHNHIPGHLSGCYYVQYDPELHNNTVFLNPNRMFTEGPRHNKYFFDPTLAGYGCYKDEMNLTIDEGDVLLWPSQLDHMVKKQPGLTKNPDGKLYITYSFNVEMVTEGEAKEKLGFEGGGQNNVPPDPGGAPPTTTTSSPTTEIPGSPEQGDQLGEWSSDWF
tara:strand:+ start:4857 stop:5729 length:873 start_codon:yes stop_codon:yes gene_type:complete